MRQASKSANVISVTIRVIVHLDDGRMLNETLEVSKDIRSPEEIVFHIWEDTFSE